MGDTAGGSRDGDRRRLETPTWSPTRRDLVSPRCSRSRSRSRHLRDRERELGRERERLRLLERDVQQDREVENRRRRSEQRSKTSEGRHDQQRRERNLSAGRHSKRSRSPIFHSKDVLNIIQSLKDGLSSQPVNQSAQSSNKSLDFKNILPEFDPSTKNQRVDVWLKKVNECASVYEWDDRTTVHFAMQKLRGLAKIWYESLNSILFTWQEWQQKLTSAFPYEQNYGQSLEDMLKRRSKFNEPIEVYYYEKLALINQCEISGKRAVDCIIHGISDKTMKSSALALRCSAPDQLLQFLLSNKETITPPYTSFKNKYTPVGNNIGKFSKQTPNSGVFCFNCKEKGHPYLQCPKPLVKCNRCSKIGHSIENCFVKEKATNGDPVPKTMCISSSKPNDKFIKKVTVNGLPLEAFVDFGSEVTLIKESIIDKLGVSHDASPSVMKGFGNDVVYSIGSVKLQLTVDGVSAVVPVRIVKDHLLDKAILIGQSFSEQPHIIVYKDATKLQFINIGAEIPYQGPCDDDDDDCLARIRVCGHARLYGAASVRAAAESVVTGNLLFNTKVIGKPGEQFIVCGGIYQVRNGFLYVTVTPCSIPCMLYKNAIISRAERVDVVNRIVVPSSDSDCLPENQLVSQIDLKQIRLGDCVSDEDKKELFDLLQHYSHCFAYDLAGLGCTNATEMKIELSSQRPVVYRPYRLSHHERDKVRGMVGEMLEAGIVRESISSYASPIILVKKKDGKVRMCIDYRMLNSITVKERYPMPIIEDEMARLAGQAWFITLDLMSGYYQVPISEQSKHLTAFVTPDGQYEFNRMPFGLANAPAVFQRMMNHVLGPARFDKATVYIDDLLVFGRSPKECLSRFGEILRLLEKANLKLNLSKCTFLRNSIDYLGYEISAEGMRPGEGKIQAVEDFPRPENVHGVRQFLGLVSYFRKFIYGFAQLAYPLTKLLKKDAGWEWQNEQEEAFSTLKGKLVERPVLAIFDPSAETELHTDASKLGIGGILLQRLHDGDPFKPVAYYSRQTTPEEKNFHSYELETLAVVCALKKFRVFLLGKNFKIVTDCSALRSTFQKRDLIPRIARWWLALQEFDCLIEYRAGAKMAHVDALSRNPVVDESVQNPEPYPAVMAISEEDWLLTLQLGDSELGRIRDILSSELDAKGLDYIRDNYVVKNNKLFRCIGGDRDNLRWVVPKGARWQLCRMNHDDIGHVGFEKTLERMKKNYWFAKMSRFVKKYVHACIECAYSKKITNTREGLLHPIPKVEKPFHTLHTDHLGPFVKSKQGNTHILAVVDSFTKFVFIKAVRNTKTQNVIKVLDAIFDTFRTPDRLISDRGSCFTSHAFRKYCLDKGIRHVLNAVASPRSNGQVERYNRTILDSLTAQNLQHNEKEWDNKLGKIQWGLNNTIQKSIGRAPSEVMFGPSMNSEVKPMLNEIRGENSGENDVVAIRSQVKDKIDKEQEKQKRYYDKGKKPARIYNNGELVKITKTVFQNQGKSSKLLAAYEGPYRIIKILGNDRYRVAPIPGFEGTKRRRKTTVAADRMQPWIHIGALEINNNDQDTSSEDDEMSENN